MSLAISSAIGCGFPLEAACARAAASGIRYLDLLVIGDWAHIRPADLMTAWEPTVARIEGLCRQHGLRPLALNSMSHVGMHERSPEQNARRHEELQAIIRLMQHLGVGVAAMQPPLFWQDPAAQEAAHGPSIQSIREQLELGRAAGVQFALELHTRSPFESMDQVQRLLAELPEVPLVYDPTHFVLQGMEIRDTVWMMRNAAHVHLRDAAPGEIQSAFGQGRVDFDWVLAALRDQGYRGHISIEYLGSPDTPFDVVDSARRLADHIYRYFPEA